VKYADEHECDLIVIPTHGRTGLRRIFLGSVAEAVLRKANCAVATIRPESGSLFKEAHSDAAAESSPATKEEGKLSMKPDGVLCAVDVNDYDQDVIDLAADLAKQFGVDLDLLHVTLFPNTANKTVYAYTGDNSVHRKERRRLDAIATEVEGVEIKSHHLLGYPAEQVLRFAQLNQPRLLVLGTHGRTGLARVFGSIASQILRDAACPVMVLRQDQNDQHFTESDADQASDESSASAIS
jgi:nucleotide-binding universal stress UspA family protein